MRGDRGVGEGIVQVGVVERTVIVGPTPSIAFSENRVDPERPIQIPPSGNPGILAIGRRGVVFQTISISLCSWGRDLTFDFTPPYLAIYIHLAFLNP